MISVNEYFDGKVKSMGLENSQGTSTVGIMKAGEYEFGTSSREYMTLVSGKWLISLPGEDDFKEYAMGVTFIVEANQHFQLKVLEDSAYLCRYE